ncbi:MAG: SAM-dependent chlorinase/fluorinase [Bacteroidota bacterium]|nr:SAM-dependent chlorinase/fluorinase [Bacteroidota bacterium]
MYSLITLISDYGLDSPYVAAIKGAVYSKIPDSLLVEITNQVSPFDLSQTAFILSSIYKNFPPGTWHIIGVDTNIALNKQFLIVESDGHYFIGADNGIFSMLFDPLPDKVYRILESNYSQNELFADKNVFVPVIAQFLKQANYKGLAEPAKVENIKQGIQPLVEENLIRGAVMFVDGFNNSITNIHKSLFEEVVKGRDFTLFYWGKHSISKLSKHYHDGKAGDDVLLFNENGFLEIAMNRGRGAQLLGLKVGSKIVVEISEEGGNQ